MFLRERTAAAHAAVDALIGGFDDLPSYTNYLRSVAAFRSPIESQLRQLSWPEGFANWRPTVVADAIALDMRDLGVGASLAPTSSLSLSRDRLYGTLYVLEGSALGAKVLYRRALALGLSAEHGARHLALQSNSIVGWRDFLDRLEDADPFDLESAVDASVATFALAQVAFEAR